MTSILDRLPEILGSYTPNDLMARHTWFGVGGPADILFSPLDEQDLVAFLADCPDDIPLFAVGAGSNLLVRDGGVAGVVIKLGTHLNAIRHEGTRIIAQTGATDADVARYAQKAGIAGLEFLIGIPGTIGGGLRMNAGAFGSEFKDVTGLAHGFDRAGKPVTATPSAMGMAYRHSDAPADWIFTSAELEGHNGDPAAIKARMRDIIASRGEAQPRGVRTGGSTFANPDGGKAWKEIQKAAVAGFALAARSVGKTLQFPDQYRQRHRRRYRNAWRDGSRACACRWRPITKMGNSPDWTQPDRRGNRMTDNRDRVAVLMGGWTSEAAVSRVSASFCGQAARNAGWDAIEVEVDRDIAAKLNELNPSRAFNALHGQIGEDGNIQGLLNIMNIPYTHSGLTASAIAMDKLLAKTLLAGAGILVPPTLALVEDSHVYPEDSTGAHVIKPRNDGSSFGVVIVPDAKARPPARNTWPAHTQLICEPYIPGRELTVSVLDGTALCVTEITSEREFYDFDAKYAVGGSKHILPANIPEPVTLKACLWAEHAYRQLGCRGIIRADYRWDDKNDQLFMLEVNTQPGMTATSLVPEQARFVGMSGEELVNHLLEIAQCDD